MVVNLQQVGAPKACIRMYLLASKGYNIYGIVALQVLIAIVLLLMWSRNLPEIRPRFDFMDLFAGEAKASIYILELWIYTMHLSFMIGTYVVCTHAIL